MQFNRTEYLNGNYDPTDPIEVVIANRALQVSGLDWNLYIKDYVIRSLRLDLIKLNGLDSIQLFQFIPLILIGMFNTCAVMLNSMSFEDSKLESFRLKWIPLLVAANDIKDEIYGT